MRFFVIIAACIGIASALSFQAPGTPGIPGVTGSGDAAVRILPTPLVYQDQVGGEAQPGAQPRFGGGQSGAQANANAYTGVGVGGYQPGVQPGFGGAYPGQSGAQAKANAYAYGGGVGGYPGQAGVQTNAKSYAGAIADAGAGGAGAISRANAEVQVRYAKPEVTKNFYYHVAPEETRTDVGVNTLTITPRKHYKVIFIKAPSISANSDSSAKAASQTEEKTLVYVLVNNKVKANTISNAKADSFLTGKPEVFFVKYENPNTQATAISNARAVAGGGESFANANANAEAGSGFGGNPGGSFAGANAGAGAGYNGDFGRTGAYANAGANAGAGGQTGGFGNGPAFNGGATAGANAGANSGSYF